GLEPQYLPDASHRHSLGWHRLPLLQAGESLCGSTRDRAPPPPGGGRLQIGIGGRLPSERVADFKSESVAGFKPESVADFRRNPQTTTSRLLWSNFITMRRTEIGYL